MSSPKVRPAQLPNSERQVLEGRERRRKKAQPLSIRSRIVMVCATGSGNTEIMRALGVSRAIVRKWRAWFLYDRLHAIATRRRAAGHGEVTKSHI